MIEIMHTFTTQAILDVYNHFAAAAGKPEKLSWKGSKQDLINKTMLLADTKTVDAYLKATEKPVTDEKPAKAKREPKPKSDKPKGVTVSSVAKELILEMPEASCADVAAAVKDKLPECNVSAKGIAFYRWQMKKAGQL